ncbi:MAG: hypothetical protein FWD57_09770, partial [Polyangiaceae bacterium]|nr:hypothetical protein [Polyangiaceae bacterium]
GQRTVRPHRINTLENTYTLIANAVTGHAVIGSNGANCIARVQSCVQANRGGGCTRTRQPAVLRSKVSQLGPLNASIRNARFRNGSQG